MSPDTGYGCCIVQAHSPRQSRVRGIARATPPNNRRIPSQSVRDPSPAPCRTAT